MRIRVPASTANLGPGFDTLGLALKLYLEVDARADEMLAKPEFQFSGQRMPIAGIVEEHNLILRAAHTTALARGGSLPPFSARVSSDIPLARGLGSSAAAVLAGIHIADRLCRLGLSAEEILAQAVALEKGHADNVAAALRGGWTISWSETTGEVGCFQIAMHPDIKVILIVPEVELSTDTARRVLPKMVPRADAVYNVQHCAALVAGLQSGNRSMIRRGLRDRLHQPYRTPLVSGLEELLAAPEIDGLLGVVLSGAGSSVVAFADHNFEYIGRQLSAIFGKHQIPAQPLMVDIDIDGVVVGDS